MEFPAYQSLGHGVTLIDTGLMRPGMAACYLLERGGRAAIIETGTNHTVPRILSLLAERGIDRAQVDYIIPTHVHLDHAGGVGTLMAELPEAQLVIHPRGARHMIDPAKLQAGTVAVYGEAAYREMYGELVPVKAERVITAEDGFELDLGGQPLQFLDTPGHASHHFCVYDVASESFFTGDTFGIAYRELAKEGRPFIFPTTTPVQFKPDALKASIRRMVDMKPKRMFLTHYGMVESPAELAEELYQQIDDYVAMAQSEEGGAALQQALTDYTLSRARQQGLTEALTAEIVAMDMQLNAQGLSVWRDSL